MATGRITKRSVDAVQAVASDTFLWDDELRGFGLKVTPAGKRSYVYQYRLGGRGAKTKRWTLGSHGSPWTATTARAEAERLALLVGQGVDPVEAERVRRKQAETLGFTDYVTAFTEGYLKTEWGDSWPLALRRLEMYAVPILKDRPLPDIKGGDVVAILDKVRDKPALARNLHAVMRKLFNWAERRDDIPVSPMHKIDPPAGAKARKRVLNEDELLALWRATYVLNDPFGGFLRVLIATLQRRSEVAGLPWSELNQGTALWHLPGERAKNDADHLVPLNALAVAELDVLAWKRKGLLFTTTGKTAISGFSRMKRSLDAKMLVELQRIFDERSEATGEDVERAVIPAWRLHDIRRTGTTRMQGLGIPIEVTERVINHTSGETAGLRGVYNLWEYSDEKRAALEAWSIWLSQLIAGSLESRNVVQLVRKRA